MVSKTNTGPRRSPTCTATPVERQNQMCCPQALENRRSHRRSPVPFYFDIKIFIFLPNRSSAVNTPSPPFFPNLGHPQKIHRVVSKILCFHSLPMAWTTQRQLRQGAGKFPAPGARHWSRRSTHGADPWDHLGNSSLGRQCW